MRSKLVRWADMIGGLTLVLFVCGQLGADEPAPVTPPVAVQAAEPAEPAEPAKPATPAVPVKRPTAAELEDGHAEIKVIHGWPLPHSASLLGIQLSPVSKPLDEQLQLKGDGALIISVRPNSTADKVGLKPNDILLRVNDKPIKAEGGKLPMDIVKSLQGKNMQWLVMRAGKTQTLAVTWEPGDELVSKPTKSGGTITLNTKIPFSEEIEIELHDFEEKIREKLHDAGIDVRMQLVKPGQFISKDVVLSVKAPALPDDLSVTFRKQGSQPGEIEVKKGDQSWTIKEDELNKLPTEIRIPVELVLGRGPMRLDFRTMTDRVARHPELLGLKNADKSSADPKEVERAAAKKLDEYHQGLGFFGYDKNSAAALKKQVDEMSRNLNKMQDDMQALRKALQERSATIKD